jgi:hypothetical protein
MTLIVGQERNEEGQGVGIATDFQLSKPFLVSSGQNASGFHENVMNIGLSCRIVEIIACGSLWQEILNVCDPPQRLVILPVLISSLVSGTGFHSKVLGISTAARFGRLGSILKPPSI